MSVQKESVNLKTPLVIVAAAVVIGGIIWASSVLIPLVFAMFFAALLNPVCNWLESKNIHRIFSAMLAVLLGLLIVIVLFGFFAIQIANIAEDFEDIEESIGGMTEQAEQFIRQNFGVSVNLDVQTVLQSAEDILDEAGDAILQGLMGIFVFLAMFVLVPVYTFLLLIYRFFLKDFLIRAYAGDDPEKTREIVNNIQQVAQKYLTGRLKVIMILAVMFSAALMAVGLEHAIFFAVFAALFDFIYFIGPIFAAILPISYALIMEDGFWMPISIVVIFYVIQMIEGNVLTPKIVGPAVSINPLITLFALFAGNLIWGIAGMILILPALSILKIIFDEIEPTKPYGFLLGDTNAQEEPTWIGKMIKKIIPW